LVFGRDMILNIQHQADWSAIKAHKQDMIWKNNQIENTKCIPYKYHVGKQVMLENYQANKYEQPYSGPYLVTRVNTNGTIWLKIGAVMDTINICHIHPFKPPGSICGGVCSMWWALGARMPRARTLRPQRLWDIRRDWCDRYPKLKAVSEWSQLAVIHYDYGSRMLEAAWPSSLFRGMSLQ
jgi:hypothetical protein